MKFGEHIARLDRAQRSHRFKVIASVAVLVLGIFVFSAWFISVHAPAMERQAEALRLAQPIINGAGGDAHFVMTKIPRADRAGDRLGVAGINANEQRVHTEKLTVEVLGSLAERTAIRETVNPTILYDDTIYA